MHRLRSRRYRRQDEGPNLGGELLAAAIAAAPSLATDLASGEVRTRPTSPRQAFDVRGQRRVIADVIDGMLADDIDDAGIRLLGVVQIGKTIGETGPRCRSVEAGVPFMRK